MIIKCHRCTAPFSPDPKTKGAWICTICNAANPNLKRHFRSLADLCIIGLIATSAFTIFEISKTGVTLHSMLRVPHTALLLTAIVFIYRSPMPWADRMVKILVFLVFGVAFIMNALYPFLRSFPVLHFPPAMIVYVLVFGYLFWLYAQVKKCTVEEQKDL